MDSYVSKPIEPQQLYQAVEDFAVSIDTERIGKRHSESADEQAAITESPEQVQADTNGIIDSEAALSQIPGSVDAVKELVPLLVDECTKQLEVVRTGLEEQDVKVVQRGSHTMKGSAEVFAAKRVVTAALRLETMAMEEDLSDSELAFSELEEEVLRLKEAIQTRLEAWLG
jgi:HPt (histidine-containing phosphotransfer) domain-containing protein